MSDDEALVGGGNLTAVEAISSRLADVTRLAERLDSHLCEAGAKSDGAVPPEDPTSASTPSKDDERSADIAAGIRKMLDDATAAAEERRPVDVQKNVAEVGSAQQQQEKPVKDTLRANVTEDLPGDGDYATATECSTTPMVQSRAASFTTASDCGDALWWDVDVPTSDVENVEIPELREKLEVVACNAARSGIAEVPTKIESVGRLDATPEIDRSNATTNTVIRQTTQEKSGKILKEVTETTTLRVSHSTHFGVTSYKLISNTLNEAGEHSNVHEMQDLRSLTQTTNTWDKSLPEIGEEASKSFANGIEYGVASKTTAEKELEPMRPKKEESLEDNSSESSLEATPGDHSRLLKFTGSLEGPKASLSSNVEAGSTEDRKPTRDEATPMEESSRLETSVESRKMNDSGIDMTPTKSKQEEEELLENMKTRSPLLASDKDVTSEDACVCEK